jgi:predicted Rossmann fold nucleotide-binding protein DprA/Smf involved in DNA uptake
MKMLDDNTQAILLLASRFGPATKQGPDPLTPMEYGVFADWMHRHSWQPRDLLHRCDDVLSDWQDPGNKVTVDRVQALLGRGMTMGIALEKWQSAGIWILTRAHSGYPDRLCRRLGRNAPAVLLGVGDQKLLNVPGLAIVGSRNILPEDAAYTKMIAAQAAREGLNVVSGGARGVDEMAMRSAIEMDGTAVGVLANDLLKSALSSTWRKYIKANQLCLVSTYYPESPFLVGNAMGRNKHVYCLSDYAVVVRSDKGRGGTWAGAKENLAKRWVPLFVKAGDGGDGNSALKPLGAKELKVPGNGDLRRVGWLCRQLEPAAAAEVEQQSVAHQNVEEISHYSDFSGKVRSLLESSTRVTLKRIKELFPNNSQKQLVDCLDRAVEDGILVRCGTRRTYKLRERESTQRELFGNED